MQSEIVKKRYVYDNLGQLIREDNAAKSKTYVYNYDTSGNIVSKYAYNLTAANVTPSGSATIYNYTFGNAWGNFTCYDSIAPTAASSFEFYSDICMRIKL